VTVIAFFFSPLVMASAADTRDLVPDRGKETLDLADDEQVGAGDSGLMDKLSFQDSALREHRYHTRSTVPVL
jgi:hypothetical protein